jgi:riboflavin biosynthesis pyrimidine reductase/pyrimidine deaminase RibD-like protein
VTERPYVLLSCAMSVDGCLDAPGGERLVLSGAADLDRVDDERASSDAIMVGAGTIRRDDPRLLIRSPERRAARTADGRPAHPIGVTLTASGDLDPAARFFSGEGAAGGTGVGAAGGTGVGAAGGTGVGAAVGVGGDAAGGVSGKAAGGIGVAAGVGGEAAGGASRDRPARLVYCASPVAARTRRRLDGLAEVVDAGSRSALAAVLADLFRRGVRRLMVEGGADLSRQFLTGGLADELQLVIAPFFVGDPRAPRFAGPGRYPYGPGHQMALAEVREVGAVVLLRYLLKAPVTGSAPQAGSGTVDAARGVGVTEPVPGHGAPGTAGEATKADRGWLGEAIELSRRCPPSATAFAVGALVVAGDGTVLATGYSRESDPHDHAEEAALAKLDPADPLLAGATLYSSLEPCRFRASRPRPCAELIIEAGLRRVVIAWREPPVFAPGGGAALLAEAGITVVEIADLAAQARAVNAGVLGG